MREIKFRAWFENELVGYLRFDVYPDCDENHLSICWAEDIGVWEQCWPPGGKGTPNIDTVEQFTGLKDKNGKEIYEGDILDLITESGQRIEVVCKWGIHNRVMDSGYECDIPSFAFCTVPDDRATFPIIENYLGKHDTEIMEIIGTIHDKETS